MIRYTCPSPDRWTALLREDLPTGEQHDLEAHLDECPDCQRVIETCAAERSTWASVPRWLSATAESDAPLKTIIERLKHSPEDGAETTDMTLEFLDPSEHPGSLGRLNQYEIIEEIGRGGMGVVLKALDPALHRVVAIKVLAPPLAISASARKRFTREARAAAAVCHEHVVTIHAVEEFKSLPYLVMQYVAGQSLQQKLDSCGPLPVADILRIGTQAAFGLAAAHAQGLVHRDIKPGNILLENGVERVRITDFGLARANDDVGVTSSGVITGTPQYMAPEQARGQALDARADLFSLGSVLYAMCTGEAPFHGSNALDVLRKVADTEPQPIRELNYAIPPWLAAIVTKLMAKDPAQRFQSAAEVAELLERCLAHVQSPKTVSLPPSIHRFAASPRRSAISRWAALVLPILAGLFVVSEGTGATHIIKSLGTIMRFRTPEGTLVVEVDDPAIKVTLDEKDLVITGAGAQEVRLKVGSHTLRAAKDGQTKTEIVSIEKDGKATVKVSFEADGPRAINDPNAKPAQLGFVKDLPRYTIAFHNEPWATVFKGLTNFTGYPVSARIEPAGTFSFLSPETASGDLRKYTLAEVIDILNDSLMQQNFLLVRRRDRFVVIPTDEKIDLNYFEHVPSYELAQRGDTELVNYVVHLEHVKSVDARAEMQKLLSPLGMAITVPGGGLSISDKAGNVRRIVQILTDLDRAESAEKVPPAPTSKVETKPRFEFSARVSISSIAGLGITSDGQLLLVSQANGSSSCFKTEDGSLTWHQFSQEAPPSPSAISPTAGVFAHSDHLGNLGIDMIRTGKRVHSWQGIGEPIRKLAFSPDGRYLLAAVKTGADSTECRLYQPPDLKSSSHIMVDVTSLAFMPEGKSYLWGSSVGHVFEQEIGDERAGEGHKLFELRDPIRRLAVSPDGRFLAAAFGSKGGVGVWELDRQAHSARKLATFRAQSEEVTSLSFSPDGKSLLTSGNDGVANLWSVSNFGRLAAFSGSAKTSPLRAVFTPDGKEVITASASGIVRFWNIQSLLSSNEPTPGDPTLGGGKGAVLGPKSATFGMLAADAPIALLFDATKRVLQIRDMSVSKELARIAVPSLTAETESRSTSLSFAISADGRRAAIAQANTLTIYDCETGKKIKDLNAHLGDIAAVVFGANGKLVATSGKTDGLVRVWDVLSLNELRSFHDFPTPATVLAFSPDGTKFLANNGSIIQTIDIRKGEVTDFRIPIGRQVTAAAFTSQGQIVALAGQTVLLWKPEKDSKVQRIETQSALTAMALTPDGERVLVGGRDGSLDLYDLANGRQYSHRTLSGPVHALSIEPFKSYSVITETADGRQLIGQNFASFADSITPPPTIGR